MSEATCGGAQRNHTSVAGGESSEGWKPLKNKGLSRRQIPLQSRESPVCLQITGRLAPDATGECRAPTQIPKNRAAPQGQPGFFHHTSYKLNRASVDAPARAKRCAHKIAAHA